MRKKLERNVQYHAAMAEYHGDALKKKGEEHKEPASREQSRSTKPTASAHPPQPDSDQVLHDMHSEVVKSLQEILDKEPLAPAIIDAEANRPVRRNLSGDLKPSAGVWH